jgi:hypothetical protein
VAGGSPPYTYAWFPLACCGATAVNISPGIYTCCINDVRSCTFCLSDTVSFSTSIEAFESNTGIVIHPNPFSEELVVRGSEFGEVVLYDIVGNEVMRGSIFTRKEEMVLNTGDLAAGLYLLRLESGGEVRNFKVVKH